MDVPNAASGSEDAADLLNSKPTTLCIWEGRQPSEIHYIRDIPFSVKKISVGIINNAGHAGSPMRIAVRELPHQIHGVRMTVSKGALHQVFRLYLTKECTVDEITLQLEGLVGLSKKSRKKGRKRQ